MIVRLAAAPKHPQVPRHDALHRSENRRQTPQHKEQVAVGPRGLLVVREWLCEATLHHTHQWQRWTY